MVPPPASVLIGWCLCHLGLLASDPFECHPPWEESPLTPCPEGASTLTLLPLASACLSPTSAPRDASGTRAGTSFGCGPLCSAVFFPRVYVSLSQTWIPFLALGSENAEQARC